LKQISAYVPRLARRDIDKIDADKSCRIIKTQALTGEQLVSPVTIPPKEIQYPRSLFSTRRLYQKRNTQLKNLIHSLLKEGMYGFTHEEIFDKKSRKKIREISGDSALKFPINQLMAGLSGTRQTWKCARDRFRFMLSRMAQIDILTSIKGVSVFIAAAIIADIADSIDVNRFKDAKHFTSYPRSAPHVANWDTSPSIRETNKKREERSSSLLIQSLDHVLHASMKLRKRYDRLAGYKRAVLVRTGLRRRVFAETCQILKKQECRYDTDAHTHETKMPQYRTFLEKGKNERNVKKPA
jgi:hypothetical protein